MSAPLMGATATALVSLVGQAEPGRPSATKPLASPVELAFEHALRLQRVARRRSGAEQREELVAAARAFSALRAEFPADADWVARAGLRAALLWRQLGEGERAQAELESLCSFETPPAWRARGWLERGHVERRARRWRSALDAYLRAASVASAPARTREDASLWAARMHDELGDRDAARRLFQWLSERSCDVFQRIRAFDEWALGYVRDDDLAAAAGVLERARAATREIAFEATPRGERVLLALARMRVIAALEASVERSAGADRSQ